MSMIKFFRKRAERKIKEKIIEMMGLIENCNELLNDILQKALKNGEIGELFDKIHMAEHGADVLRRSILDEIERSAFPPENKVVLTQLVKSLDVIADWHLTVSRVIRAITKTKKLTALPENFKEIVFKAMDANTKSVKGVKRALEALLSGDTEVALGVADEVERLEELVDRYFSELTSMIYSGEINKVGLSEIAVYQMVESIENIADACENACDEIRVAAVSFTKDVE